MTDRDYLIQVIKEREFDFNKSIPVEKIGHILNECWFDFYLEWLTSSCWDGEMTIYLDYYDSNVDAVILIDDMEWSYIFESEEDMVDYILSLEKLVEKYRQKFLSLNQKGNDS